MHFRLIGSFKEGLVILMTETLRLRRLAIMPTLKCTLNCKLCSNYMPFFRNSEKHVGVEELKADIDGIFRLIDFTEWLQFIGGEVFMRKDLSPIYQYCLEEYSEQFDKLIFITNATVLPCKDDIIVFKEYGDRINIQVSDYGIYSCKRKELCDLFDENKIPYIVKNYHGDFQYCGGWVDNTHFYDRGKSQEDLEKQFSRCGQVAIENFHMYRGILHGCARSLLASRLGKVIPARRDFVDIHDQTMSDEEKRDIIRHFNDHPRVSCKSCVSFNEDIERFPAAEQLGE